MENILAFIVVFGLLVFFHELGHFLFAKNAGILVREFAIGFGPKIFSYKKKETLYTVRLLPLGGYVQMAGQDDEPVVLTPGYRVGLMFNEAGEVSQIMTSNLDKYPNIEPIEVAAADLEKDLFVRGIVLGDESETVVTYPVARNCEMVDGHTTRAIAPLDRQFNSKSWWHRFMTIAAGPLFNFILAFFLFIVFAFASGGVPTDDARMGEVQSGSAAAIAGVKADDVIKTINGEKIESWTDMTTIVRANPQKELAFSLERDGEVKNITITPKKVTQDTEKVGQIGVMAPKDSTISAKLNYGVDQTVFWFKQIFVSLKNMVSGGFSLDSLGGPVYIYQSTATVVSNGAIMLLQWGAVLSINLGIINLLPIPALDGGRLLFLIVEAVRRKPLDSKKEGLVTVIGFALLMLLMVLVTWNDITRFFFK
ncbi:RIP metalloprotease RseP [Brochothrix campestris]|uniref:Zinc metalloprotease n=1 Tax=Brochothrix campestris FSL F6-1037 TaxID=1265861 RepID=W7CNN3_9LIST|nr:RIP metalloprotease RseP [Brochothrix campestris]EUJ41149.1 membrane-associated zinc metalloprotease [Brochothrix campestris FSL F6-1037]